MKHWSLVFQKDAEKDLALLDTPIRKRIIKKLDFLVKNFDRIIPMPLAADFRGFYKLRIGDWRIIYSIDRRQDIISVVYIEHRSRVYEK